MAIPRLLGPLCRPRIPNLYLEQVDGARALTTVKAWNATTLAKLEKQPGFADYRAKALALLSTNQKIAEPDPILGDKVLNFWQDEQHPRGIWRVSPLAAFAPASRSGERSSTSMR